MFKVSKSLIQIITNNDLAKIILDKLYPVGSIYLETTNTNPSAKLGGTWVAYGASDTYLRLGGNGSGGSNSTSYTPAGSVNSHTLTLNEIPSHTHTFRGNSNTTSNAGSHTHAMQYKQTQNTDSDHNRWYLCPSPDKTNSEYMGWAGDHTHTLTPSGTNSNTGGNGGHNHGFTGTKATISVTPKYVQVYAWKRTA